MRDRDEFYGKKFGITGKNLLVSLAQGDMLINDFNAKEDIK
jgi:hypothetical protein